MPSNLKWKLIATAVSVVLALYILVPTFFTFTEGLEAEQSSSIYSKIAHLFPKKAVNLGLDLRGGMYLEMNVDLKEAMENRVDVLIAQMERSLDKAKFPDVKLTRDIANNNVKVQVAPSQKSALLESIKESFGDVFVEDRTYSPSADPTQAAAPSTGSVFELKVTEAYSKRLKDLTISQAVEAVRNRIDRYGVAETSIERQGEDRIIVELPGVKDPDRVIDVIRKTGLLEFRLVDTSLDQGQLMGLVRSVHEEQKLPEGYSKDIVEKINIALQGKIPEDSEIIYEVERDPLNKQIVGGTPYLVKKRADVTGDMLQNAQVGVADNEPFVSLAFNKLGSKNFAEVTKSNVGKRLAIVLDGFISTAPVIETAILNGEARITLGYGNYQSILKEAEDLSLLLREGALPAALTVATKTLIGPSLGNDSITRGLYSMIIATVVIIIFMALYYKWGGMLANVALLLNMVYIFAVLALFQASLTLPGIAGIVLTMGMAVDANVIIFERMREEIRMGKNVKTVIQAGYEHAMSAIVDSNLTTLIAGVVLYQFGTGPIKGFATTLMIGIVTTMFTAVVFTRMIYDYFLVKRKIKKISI